MATSYFNRIVKTSQTNYDILKSGEEVLGQVFDPNTVYLVAKEEDRDPLQCSIKLSTNTKPLVQGLDIDFDNKTISTTDNLTYAESTDSISIIINTQSSVDVSRLLNGHYWIRFHYLSTRYKGKKWVSPYIRSHYAYMANDIWLPILLTTENTSFINHNSLKVTTQLYCKDFFDAIIYNSADDDSFLLPRHLLFGMTDDDNKIMNSLSKKPIIFNPVMNYIDLMNDLGANMMNKFNAINKSYTRSYTFPFGISLCMHPYDSSQGNSRVQVSNFISGKLVFKKTTGILLTSNSNENNEDEEYTEDTEYNSTIFKYTFKEGNSNKY